MQLPEFQFKIASKLKDQKGQTYIINDITYSVLEDCWYYRYSYWQDGYEHYCYARTDFVESRYEVV